MRTAQFPRQHLSATRVFAARCAIATIYSPWHSHDALDEDKVTGCSPDSRPCLLRGLLGSGGQRQFRGADRAFAVWTPPANDLARIHQLCKAASGADFTGCFITQMSAFGASAEAISFTRTYAEQNRGAIAFLLGFRPVDLVDVGYAYFPAGADYSQRWLLLNGSPAIIDVDDL